MRITFKMKHAVAVSVAVAALIVLGASAGETTVFHARDEALRLAFPDADRTQARDFFLTEDQRAAIERDARSPVDSDLLTVYLGYAGDRLLGYAIFDTHAVRTLPETFLTVLSTDGEIEATYVIAFHEPMDYLPTESWLRQFDGKRLADDLRVGRGIVAITGSTLSSHAVMGGVRRALAIHAVLLSQP